MYFIFISGAICYRNYCHAYWGCKKAECQGCIGKFKGQVTDIALFLEDSKLKFIYNFLNMPLLLMWEVYT